MINVIISNPKEFNRKKTIFIKNGKDKIHVVSDFDRTLTTASSTSIISKLRDGRYLSKDYAKKAHELFNKYYPIEINPNINYKEKSEKMDEWWKAHIELLIKYNLDKQTLDRCIKNIIKERSVKLRYGVKEFFELLRKNKIPIIIMSSSIEDLIKGFIKQKGLYSDNIHVIANSFEYKNKEAVRIKRIIHIFNKHEIEIKNLKIYNELLKRKNVLLLGDSLGDLGMIEGFPYKNLIKIAFLNDDKNLQEYKSYYDVVILNDGNFSFINELVKDIVKN